MRDFQLRTDLERVVISGFALPLGLAPAVGRIRPPVQGYTVSYMPGEEDEPDTYSFHVVVSHERLAPIVHRAFDLLPDQVFGIVEIGSRDAYRSTDTFIGEETISFDEFLDVWMKYEPFLLEDGSIAAGANSDEPFVEVFVDQWKGLSIHVPLDMRDDVEQLLQKFGIEEVQQTWPNAADSQPGLPEPPIGDVDDESQESQVRPVLDLTDEYSPDVDELLLNLRHDWKLTLNVDPESNLDEGGRKLGSTLWHAVVIVDRSDDENEAGRASAESNGKQGAYASIWATASSLSEMDRMVDQALEQHPEWSFAEVYTMDRVAFDERPDELGDLTPHRRAAQIHLVTIEPWGPTPPNKKTSESPRRSPRPSSDENDER